MGHDSIQGEAKPSGEAWVWLSAAGLSIGLLMVAGLLGLIVRNGLKTFWPKEIVRIELAEGSRFAMRGTNVLGGGIAGTRRKIVQRAPEGSGTEREWHLQIGNKDVYGAGFRFVDVEAAVRVERPAEAIWVERMEYGPAIGEPVALVGADGREIRAGEVEFEEAMRGAVEEAAELRREIREIERGRIGRINHELEELGRKERKGGTPGKEEAEWAEKRRTFLQCEYEGLAAEAADLREDLQVKRFVYRLFTGETASFPAGQMVGYHYPNRMGLFAKCVHTARGLWAFVVDDPREANMEGGIFPALFGTLAMTLLMSAAVMPFGILSAIYLREYARQGAFVRLVRISVNNLAGVPSIVFGVFGLGFFVYFVGGTLDEVFFADALPTPTFGTGGILWASLTLALMTVPVVIVATEEALASVPRGAREGSLALGASKWQTIWRVVLPASGPGILTGLVLAMARGAGEVAPLMLVGVVKLAPSLPIDGLAPFVHLDRKFMHLGFHIFDLGFQSPDSDAAQPMVFAATLFLVLTVVLLNLGAIVVRERLRRRNAAGAF